jgi:excisionase family DNA binding protein
MMAKQRVIELRPGDDWVEQLEAGEAFRFGTSTDVAASRPTSQRQMPKAEFRPKRTRVMDIDALMTPQEVADRLRVDRTSVYEWIYEKRLIAVRVGRHYRIPLSAVLEFLGA